MKVNHDKAMKRWRERLKPGATLKESHIVALRSLLHKLQWRENATMGPEGSPTNTLGLLLDLVGDCVAEAPLAITPEQTAKGLAWLRAQVWTLNGKARKNDPLGSRERAILLDFDRFTFDGLREEYRPGGMATYSPIYRVHAKNGASFAYTSGPWQSGAALEVVG